MHAHGIDLANENRVRAVVQHSIHDAKDVRLCVEQVRLPIIVTLSVANRESIPGRQLCAITLHPVIDTSFHLGELFEKSFHTRIKVILHPPTVSLAVCRVGPL